MASDIFLKEEKTLVVWENPDLIMEKFNKYTRTKGQNCTIE